MSFLSHENNNSNFKSFLTSIMKPIVFFFFLIYSGLAFSQVGGNGVFSFLNLPANAKNLALGSNFISDYQSKDNSLTWQNPAMLNAKMDNALSFSYNNYVSDIQFGSIAYAKDFKKFGTYNIGLMYMDYGKFEGYDPNGIKTQAFSVKDQCFYLGWSQSISPKFRQGVNLKYVYSIYEAFVSNGVALDYSLQYVDTSNKMNLTGFVRNIGFQAFAYGETKRDHLQTEVAITLSKRLKYLPFTYYLTAHNLQQPDMRYVISETGVKDENGDERVKKMTIGDNVLRHFNIAGEFQFGKRMALRFGYNHNKRKELTQDQRRGTSGFSWGIGMNLGKINFSYGSSAFMPGINQNQFSLLLNINDFSKKNQL